MKNLLLICALVFASSSLFGQSVSLKLTDISGAAINLKSANLEQVSLKDARGQNKDGVAYVITRNQNDLSASIMSAATKLKTYAKAELVVTLKNGTKITHDLTSVALSNYTSKNIAGKATTEQFYLQFMTDVIQGKK